MPLLIDGYNLLHVTGLFGRGPRGSLEQSRQALLNFLGAAVEARERARTTVVFDAAEAPPGLPDIYTAHGMTVRYARDFESADELLELLIAEHHTPRRLTVVSSDHRVQRAARRRKATAVDSHPWYVAAAEKLKHRKKRRPGAATLPDVKPDAPLTPAEVEAWLAAFGPIDVPEPEVPPALAPPTPPPPPGPPRKQTKPRAATKKPRTRSSRRRPRDLGFGDLKNPFPPGYGEDMEKES